MTILMLRMVMPPPIIPPPSRAVTVPMSSSFFRLSLPPFDSHQGRAADRRARRENGDERAAAARGVGAVEQRRRGVGGVGEGARLQPAADLLALPRGQERPQPDRQVARAEADGQHLESGVASIRPRP